MATSSVSGLIRCLGGLFRSFSAKTNFRTGPGLKEFVNSGTVVGVHQSDSGKDRVPYLGKIDLNGDGRKGAFICCA